MDKIEWCIKQKKGIRKIEPNSNMSRSYFKKSEESILMMTADVPKNWKIIGAYYACYNALYAILIKAGIKSEIHDCSIYLMNYLNFNTEDIKFMEILKQKRINVQYYIDNDEEMVSEQEVKKFVLKCKELSENIDIQGLRNKIFSLD